MPGTDGMALARELVSGARPPAIIFCTAHEHFAVEAFDIAAVDYLLKPVSHAALERAVCRVHDRLAATSPPSMPDFWVPHLGELVRVAADAIDWIEAERDYVRLHVGQASYLMLATITGLEQRLDSARFVRLRRSAIARQDFVATLIHEGAGVWATKLRSGERLRIGRRFQGALDVLRQVPDRRDAPSR